MHYLRETLVKHVKGNEGDLRGESLCNAVTERGLARGSTASDTYEERLGLLGLRCRLIGAVDCDLA